MDVNTNSPFSLLNEHNCSVSTTQEFLKRIQGKHINHAVVDAGNKTFLSAIAKLSQETSLDLAVFVEKLTQIFDTHKPAAKSGQEDIYDRFKINFVTAIIEFNRQARFLSDKNLINSHMATLSDGTNFSIATESLMGIGRMFSNNSDATYVINKDSPSKVLLAAVADGVSGQEADRELATGKLASNTVINYIKDHQNEFNSDLALPETLTPGEKKFNTFEDIFRAIFKDHPYRDYILANLETLIRPGLNKSSNLSDLYLFPNGLKLKSEEESTILNNITFIGENFKEDQVKEFLSEIRPDDYRDGRISKFALGLIDENKLRAKAAQASWTNVAEFCEKYLVKDYKKILSVIKVLADANKEIVNPFKKAATNSSAKSLSSQTTLSCAIDHGDQIILVSVGDSVACALDKNGKIIENSLNDPDQRPTGVLDSSIAVNRENGEFNCCPAWMKLSVKLVPKQDFGSVLLCSDGLLHSDERETRMKILSKALAQNSSSVDPRDIALSLFRASSRSDDDKSIVVLTKDSSPASQT